MFLSNRPSFPYKDVHDTLLITLLRVCLFGTISENGRLGRLGIVFD